MAKLNSGFKRWSLDRHDVSVEVLEDMGVSLLDDDSCSSTSSKVVAITRREAVKRKDAPSPFKVDQSEDELSVDSFLLSKRKRIDGPLGLDAFSKLSDEVILCIFKLLPKSTVAKCAQVSKRWRRLSYDEFLWKRLDLSGISLKPTVLGTVLFRGTQALRLAKTEICDPIYCESSLARPLYPSVRNLQFLDLSMSTISTTGLCELFKTCRSLVKLSLEHCTLDDKGCEEIGKNPNLSVLNMSMCYGVTENCLKFIMDGCPELESWNLAWTDLSPRSLSLICTSAPELLRRINLSGCRITLKDSHVYTLCRRCPNLVELDVSDAGLLVSAVEYIHDRLHNLEYLAMSRCYRVSVNSFLVFQRSQLLYLDVYGMFPESILLQLRANLPAIEINKLFFSSVARPTVGIRRTSIWGIKVRE